MRRKTIRRLAAALAFALLLTVQMLPTLAYADDAGEQDAVTIRITPPSGAALGKTAVEIRVTDNIGDGFKTVQVKTADTQAWRDLTPYLEKQENRYYGAVEISENCTVSVRVTANDGTIYEKSRRVECYDSAVDAPYTVEQVTGDALTPVKTTGAATPARDLASTALTPDGQGTVLDNVSSADGKEFFTITTPAENIFYLVIDKQRDGENVYFLNAVTEADLMALAESDTGKMAGTGASTGIPGLTEPASSPAVCICKDKCVPSEVNTGCPVCAVNYKSCEGAELAATPQPQPDTGSGGTLVIVVIVLLAVMGAGYYFKIYKPKREMDDAEDVDAVTGGAEEKTVNEDELPAYHARRAERPVPDEPPEPDYPTYEDYQRGDEPPEPEYEE